MSVRATERLIGEVVIASGLQNSARMVVQSVDEAVKQVTTIWFSDDKAVQTGIFPVSALDRAEQKVAKSSAAKTKAAARTGAAAKKTTRKR